jgi:glutaredoxin-like YruB-family protein
MTTSKVTVYTATGCPHCKAAKEFLTNNGVSFTEKNVAEDESAARELSERGIQSVPTIDTGEKTITGFDRSELKAALDLS